MTTYRDAIFRLGGVVSTGRLAHLMNAELRGGELTCTNIGSLPYIAKDLDLISEALGRSVRLNIDTGRMTKFQREWAEAVIAEPQPERMP